MPSTITSASTTPPTSTVGLHESDDTLNADLIEELEEVDISATADTEANTEFSMQISTIPTSAVGLNESDDTLNEDLIEELEEIDISTTADTEANTEFPMQILTPAAESIIWSSTKSHKINKIDEGDNYLTTLKISTETIISTGSSSENTTVTVIYPLTSTAIVSNSTSVTSDINSTERSAELPTDKNIKFSENIKNKNLLQEIKSESSSDSLPVNGDTSLKRDENMSILSNRSKHEKVKVKRHAKVDDKEGNENIEISV
jgi:hypothetical protein